MEIDSETDKEYPDDEIVAHCLEEMTFCGFSKKDVSKTTEERGFIRKDDPWAWFKFFTWRIRVRFGRKMSIEEFLAQDED